MSNNAGIGTALLLLAFQIALGGCAQTNASPDSNARGGTSEAQTFVFECAGDYGFVARVETDRAWLFLPGRTVELPRVRSASGAKFAGDDTSFWSKGEEAMLETGAARHNNCKNNRAKAIWEHAKLNGADFRAIGNEPGWHMEISNKNNILLVTDYGQKTFRFHDATVKPEPQNRMTIYKARNENSHVEVVITGEPCTDTMSGESFSATASVRINGKTYSGCGRALH